MADKEPTLPKSGSPPWLSHAGARVDEFARQAFLQNRNLNPPPPADDGPDSWRRKKVEGAKHGVNFDSAASSSSGPSTLRDLAFIKATPASFAPERHIFYVLGRPVVVPGKQTGFLDNLTLHT